MSENAPENDIEIELDEDLEDDDSGNEQDGDPDDSGQEEKPYKPPSKSEWDRLQRRIKKLTEAKGKPAADVDRKLRDQISGGKDEEDEAPVDSRWRDIAITNAAAAQISAAGFRGSAKQAARLANLIDRSGIEPDSHGAFDLEDEIEELREEYPQLFSAETGGRRAPRVRTGPSGEKTPAKDPTATTSAKMMRQAGYR